VLSHGDKNMLTFTNNFHFSQSMPILICNAHSFIIKIKTLYFGVSLKIHNIVFNHKCWARVEMITNDNDTSSLVQGINGKWQMANGKWQMANSK
jgi:hypothetical protein